MNIEVLNFFALPRGVKSGKSFHRCLKNGSLSFLSKWHHLSFLPSNTCRNTLISNYAANGKKSRPRNGSITNVCSWNAFARVG